MTEEERKDYLNYIENYTIYDLADEFNTQSFIITNTNEFNKILLYHHFKQNEEIKQLQQENQELKEVIEKAIDYISSNDIEVLKYHDIPSETSSYEIVTVDLLKILKGGENE